MNCTIYGTPQGKGSKVIGKNKDKTWMREDNPRTKPWMQCAISAIRGAIRVEDLLLAIMGSRYQPLDGPLRLDATFFFRRPKGHTKKQRECPYCFTRTDRDKLLRALQDALTQSGAIVDDRRICAGRTDVRYCADGEAERTEFVLEVIELMHKDHGKGGKMPKGMPMKEMPAGKSGGKKK